MDQPIILKNLEELDVKLRTAKENKFDVDDVEMRGLIKYFEHVMNMVRYKSYSFETYY